MASVVDDYALALQLQEQFDREDEIIHVGTEGGTSYFSVDNVISGSNNQSVAGKSGSSLCDETWELIDPSPDAWALFIEFNQKFFWGKLTGVELKWSNRMTL